MSKPNKKIVNPNQCDETGPKESRRVLVTVLNGLCTESSPKVRLRVLSNNRLTMMGKLE